MMTTVSRQKGFNGRTDYRFRSTEAEPNLISRVGGDRTDLLAKNFGYSGMQKQIRSFWRISMFVLTITGGLAFCIVSSFIGGDRAALTRNMIIRRNWIKLISLILGLRIVKEGRVVPDTVLYVSNHRSFSDPLVALHYVEALPLAKAEVNNYPLIGFGARITGILYVKRESMQSRKSARDALEKTLNQGMSVLVYPEGTTNDEDQVLPFKKGSFEIAHAMNIPVIPIAIEYEDPNDHWSDATLWEHYRQQFGKSHSRCKIRFGKPISSSDGLTLCLETEKKINSMLAEIRAEFVDS